MTKISYFLVILKKKLVDKYLIFLHNMYFSSSPASLNISNPKLLNQEKLSFPMRNSGTAERNMIVRNIYLDNSFVAIWLNNLIPFKKLRAVTILSRNKSLYLI